MKKISYFIFGVKKPRNSYVLCPLKSSYFIFREVAKYALCNQFHIFVFFGDDFFFIFQISDFFGMIFFSYFILGAPDLLHIWWVEGLNPEASAHHNLFPMCFCTRPSEGESESAATRQGNQRHVGDDFDLCRGIFGGSSWDWRLHLKTFSRVTLALSTTTSMFRCENTLERNTGTFTCTSWPPFLIRGLLLHWGYQTWRAWWRIWKSSATTRFDSSAQNITTPSN